MINLRKIELSKQIDPAPIKAGRFFDYVLEMYAPPSAVKFRSVVNGRAGFAHDKMRIRGYFKAATEDALGSKE